MFLHALAHSGINEENKLFLKGCFLVGHSEDISVAGDPDVLHGRLFEVWLNALRDSMWHRLGFLQSVERNSSEFSAMDYWLKMKSTWEFADNWKQFQFADGGRDESTRAAS